MIHRTLWSRGLRSEAQRREVVGLESFKIIHVPRNRLSGYPSSPLNTDQFSDGLRTTFVWFLSLSDRSNTTAWKEGLSLRLSNVVYRVYSKAAVIKYQILPTLINLLLFAE